MLAADRVHATNLFIVESHEAHFTIDRDRQRQIAGRRGSGYLTGFRDKIARSLARI